VFHITKIITRQLKISGSVQSLILVIEWIRRGWPAGARINPGGSEIGMGGDLPRAIESTACVDAKSGLLRINLE
jgi:hypothetical protein